MLLFSLSEVPTPLLGHPKAYPASPSFDIIVLQPNQRQNFKQTKEPKNQSFDIQAKQPKNFKQVHFPTESAMLRAVLPHTCPRSPPFQRAFVGGKGLKRTPRLAHVLGGLASN